MKRDKSIPMCLAQQIPRLTLCESCHEKVMPILRIKIKHHVLILCKSCIDKLKNLSDHIVNDCVVAEVGTTLEPTRRLPIKIRVTKVKAKTHKLKTTWSLGPDTCQISKKGQRSRIIQIHRDTNKLIRAMDKAHKVTAKSKLRFPHRIDGVKVSVGDRLLIKTQNRKKINGIYKVKSKLRFP